MTGIAGTDDSIWTVGQLLTWTSEYLARHGVPDARLASEVLLAHAVGCRRIDLYARFDQVPEPERVDAYRDLVRRAAAREPIAYLVGEKEFFSRSFLVTNDVLIPRPETETLVEVVLDHCRSRGLERPRVLDIGTGSGCIAVTLLAHMPAAVAMATDVSAAALNVARLNAERHAVIDRLRLIETDRLNLPQDVVPAEGFDVVACNPPYVAAGAVSALDAGIRKYEPMLAVCDGSDGLSFYRSLAPEARRVVANDGALVFEVGDGQAAAVVDTVKAAGGWVHGSTVKDRVSGQDRVVLFNTA